MSFRYKFEVYLGGSRTLCLHAYRNINFSRLDLNASVQLSEENTVTVDDDVLLKESDADDSLIEIEEREENTVTVTDADDSFVVIEESVKNTVTDADDSFIVIEESVENID